MYTETVNQYTSVVSLVYGYGASHTFRRRASAGYVAPGSIERMSVQMSRPQKQDSPVAQDRCWGRECFCAFYQFLCLLPSSNALIYKEARSLYYCTSLQRVDATLRKRQHLLQLSATEEGRPPK